MGVSHGNFVKYPRTPHLFGSKGTDDDKHLGEKASRAFIADDSLIIEEKLDGTNVGLHFDERGDLVLQCRGHEIREGMHPQYDLFKQWASVKRLTLQERLGTRYILFGEWLYAKHSVFYRQLTHYFYEFDIYDKVDAAFLSLERRLKILSGSGIETVPVIHRGKINQSELADLITDSHFDSLFDNPLTMQTDSIMEGLYLRVEQGGHATGRAKFVRKAFVEKIKQSTHWQHQEMVPNELAANADIWQ